MAVDGSGDIHTSPTIRLAHPHDRALIRHLARDTKFGTAKIATKLRELGAPLGCHLLLLRAMKKNTLFFLCEYLYKLYNFVCFQKKNTGDVAIGIAMCIVGISVL